MAVAKCLEHLPVDAVEYITKYLSLSDLSRCCAVSHTWRKVFINDIFWRKRFNKNITDYLKETKCLVEPAFTLVSAVNLSSEQNGNYMEHCLRESHLWQNWRSGKFVLKNLEFDFEEDISYNIKVEFFDNDHVLLHRTFQTEVWNVAQDPWLVLEIPFNLNELFEENVYKVVGNKLVVVQCNLVQVFSMCLESRTSTLNYLFFFDKIEEYVSSNLLDPSTIVEKVFKEASFITEDNIECVVCGTFLVGVISTDNKNLVIHVWDINTGKKLKEDACPTLPSIPCDITLKAGEETHDKIIVIFEMDLQPSACVFLYDLKKLNFVLDSKFQHSICDFTLFDKYLCGLGFSELVIVEYDFDGDSLHKPLVIKVFLFEAAGSLRILGNNILVSNVHKQVFTMVPWGPTSQKDFKLLINLDFSSSSYEVLHNRFIAFHDLECSLKEIWQVGESSKKIMSFPEDIGTYRAVNHACTRLVLERGNKLIVLSFW